MSAIANNSVSEVSDCVPIVAVHQRPSLAATEMEEEAWRTQPGPETSHLHVVAEKPQRKQPSPSEVPYCPAMTLNDLYDLIHRRLFYVTTFHFPNLDDLNLTNSQNKLKNRSSNTTVQA